MVLVPSKTLAVGPSGEYQHNHGPIYSPGGATQAGPTINACQLRHLVNTGPNCAHSPGGATQAGAYYAHSPGGALYLIGMSVLVELTWAPMGRIPG
jgi:hypothetical protein